MVGATEVYSNAHEALTLRTTVLQRNRRPWPGPAERKIRWERWPLVTMVNGLCWKHEQNLVYLDVMVVQGASSVAALIHVFPESDGDNTAAESRTDVLVVAPKLMSSALGSLVANYGSMSESESDGEPASECCC